MMASRSFILYSNGGGTSQTSQKPMGSASERVAVQRALPTRRSLGSARVSNIGRPSASFLRRRSASLLAGVRLRPLASAAKLVLRPWRDAQTRTLSEKKQKLSPSPASPRVCSDDSRETRPHFRSYFPGKLKRADITTFFSHPPTPPPRAVPLTTNADKRLPYHL